MANRGTQTTVARIPTAGATDVYTYDSADKLQYVSSPSGDKSYFYDGDGRTRTIASSAGNTTFSYDYEGHVTGISYPNSTTNSFNYNGLGTRVKRTDVASGTRTFLHDGLGPADGVLFDGTVSFTPGVSERTSAGLDRWYNADGLGSLTDITDAFGNTTNRTWDAFGNQKTGTNFIYLHGYGESGNYQEDKDSGLKLCGLRYYDSTVGRFLSPDPASFGTNWYEYCGNNPTGFEDPLGLRRYNIVDEDGTYGAYAPHSAQIDDYKENGFYEFAVGLGDGCSFGLTKIIRAHMGTNDEVDEDNGFHFTGEMAGQTISEYILGAWAGKAFQSLKLRTLRFPGMGGYGSPHFLRIENGFVHLIPRVRQSAVRVLHFHVVLPLLENLHLPYQLWPAINGIRGGYWLYRRYGPGSN